MYASPTFEGGPPQRWSVKAAHGGNVVVVDGIPDVRLSRRADWGWELRNHLWVARSLVHHAQPTQRCDFDALFQDEGPCRRAYEAFPGRRRWTMV